MRLLRLLVLPRHNASVAPSAPLSVTWLHRMGVCNALQLHVFQGRTPGHQRVTPEQAASALALFRDELTQQILLRQAALATTDLERQFEELSLRHTANYGFRTYDLLHVSSALLLRCDTFWSFDPKANKLAGLEGLETLARLTRAARSTSGRAKNQFSISAASSCSKPNTPLYSPRRAN